MNLETRAFGESKSTTKKGKRVEGRNEKGEKRARKYDGKSSERKDNNDTHKIDNAKSAGNAILTACFG